MTERQITPETEQAIAIVDEWIMYLSEHHAAKELDRGVLRTALEACGASFELEDSERERLSRNHYDLNKRRPAVKKIWEGKYEEFTRWTDEYIEKFENDRSIKVPAMKSGKKHLGFTGLLEELTAYAATDDESYSAGDFETRITARAWNGHMRYDRGLPGKEFRMYIKVPDYNTINFVFTDRGYEEDYREEDLPLAPLGFPPQFANDAWNQLKTP